MATLQFPLSGPVSQLIKVWTTWLSGNQINLLKIDLGKSGDPDVERKILDDVGSYGRQLGRIGDVLIVLLRHFHPKERLTDQEQKAIVALELMLDDVAEIKEGSHRQAMRLNHSEERAVNVARSSSRRTSEKKA